MLIGATIGLGPARGQQEPKFSLIWQQDNLSGNWGGKRASLKEKGIYIDTTSIDEVFVILSRGARRQASYEGQLEFTDQRMKMSPRGGSCHSPIASSAVRYS
jgi:hypothetical protein